MYHLTVSIICPKPLASKPYHFQLLSAHGSIQKHVMAPFFCSTGSFGRLGRYFCLDSSGQNQSPASLFCQWVRSTGTGSSGPSERYFRPNFFPLFGSGTGRQFCLPTFPQIHIWFVLLLGGTIGRISSLGDLRRIPSVGLHPLPLLHHGSSR
jgi:hypothetical protein